MDIKYELVQDGNLGDSGNTIANINDLKELAMTLAQEYKFEMVDGNNGWGEFIVAGKKITNGFALDGFKDEVFCESTLFALCSEILNITGINVYRIHPAHKEKISYMEVMPNSVKDNDQLFYQMGFDSQDVSEVQIYVDNTHIASYGSFVCGIQKVWCNTDENDIEKLVPINSGDELVLNDNPDVFFEALAKQKESGDEYLAYGNNCWLEYYFTGVDKSDLTDNNPQLQISSELVHSSIFEGFGIGDVVINEIIKNTTKKSA